MQHKKVLITGASSGIGEAAAHAFASLSCELFLVARRREQLEQVAGECRRRGARQAVWASHDLSRPGQGAVIVDECLRQLQGLDVVISNAGYGVSGPMVEISPEQMARIWQVNYQSGYETIHAALPQLHRQGSGHIVLVSSVIGKRAMPYTSAYCVTKFAQAALAESLWGELRGSGVGISLICPGFTDTEFHDRATRTSSARAANRPFRADTSETVARAIVKAVRRRRREVHLTGLGRLLIGMNRLSPALTARATAWIGQRQLTTRKQESVLGAP
jgi:short-subunit dehydrogenase